jgi:hypothetical protein
LFLRIPKQNLLTWMKKLNHQALYSEINWCFCLSIFAAFPKNVLQLCSSLVLSSLSWCLFWKGCELDSRLVHPIGFTLDILWFINPSSDFLRVSVFSFLLLHNFITFLCLLSVDPALVLCHCEVAGLLAFPRRWCLVSNIQLIGNESYESISSAILKCLQDFPKRFQPPSPPAQLGRNHSHVSNLGRLSWSFKPGL